MNPAWRRRALAHPTVPVAHVKPGIGATVKHVLTSYPYLIPAIFFFVGWQILPIISALRLSFTDDRFLDHAASQFYRTG